MAESLGGGTRECREVCLVSMPFPPLNQPSMALGLLKAALVRADISVKTLFPCLWLAEEIGLDLYTLVADSKQEFLAGEWVFGGAAFPDHHPDHESYLDRILSAPVSRGLLQKSRFADDPRWALREARRAAPAFVERAARRVLAYRPRIVGCTSTFMQHCASLALLRVIREMDPSVATIIGGANCEGAMGAAVAECFSWLDFVFSGEAEFGFPELCRLILSRGVDIPVADLPDGVINRAHPCVRSDGAAPRAAVQQMDSTPIPDFDDYFSELAECSFRRFVSPALAMETSRGCWWGEVHHCTFCGLNGGNMNFRSKTPERVLSELDFLSERYGIRKFNIVDNILDLRYLRSLFPRLAAAPPYTLFYETKSNLKRGQLQAIAAAGIRRLQPGLENMHDAVLRLIDKGTTALQNVRLLKWARELGIFITWNFLWDVPGEQDEWYGEMAEWLPLVCHLQPPGIDRIQFHRFSPYHQRPEQFGLTLIPYPLYAFVYPVAPARLRDLAYYFDTPDRPSVRAELKRRPNLQRVIRIIGAWNKLWGQAGMGAVGEKPALLMHETTEGVYIHDTRPCATASTCFIGGLSARVYYACSDIQSIASLQRVFAASGGPLVSETDLEETVHELRHRRLLLEIGGRFLALALREASTIPDAPENFPGGVTDIEAWLREREATKDHPAPLSL
jgi:ribosomal peptide maturation radical SAM protein 1